MVMSCSVYYTVVISLGFYEFIIELSLAINAADNSDAINNMKQW